MRIAWFTARQEVLYAHRIDNTAELCLLDWYQIIKLSCIAAGQKHVRKSAETSESPSWIVWQRGKQIPLRTPKAIVQQKRLGWRGGSNKPSRLTGEALGASDTSAEGLVSCRTQGCCTSSAVRSRRQSLIQSYWRSWVGRRLVRRPSTGSRKSSKQLVLSLPSWCRSAIRSYTSAVDWYTCTDIWSAWYSLRSTVSSDLPIWSK